MAESPSTPGPHDPHPEAGKNSAPPLWTPPLTHGALIQLAPLWRLVPQHTAMQTEYKPTGNKLVKGDYYWAHLSMHLWP